MLQAWAVTVARFMVVSAVSPRSSAVVRCVVKHYTLVAMESGAVLSGEAFHVTAVAHGRGT